MISIQEAQKRPGPRNGMSPVIIWVVNTLFVLFILLMAVMLYANTTSGKRHISQFASSILKRPITLHGNIYLKAKLPLTLHISGLTVGNIEGGKAEHMADIGVVEIAPYIGSLFDEHKRLRYVRLKDSAIHLERLADKRANWTFGEEEKTLSEPAAIPTLQALSVQNSVLTYRDVPQRTDIRLTSETEGDTLHLKGEGTHLGQPFHLNAVLGQITTVQEAMPIPLDMTLNVGHTRLHAEGSLENIATLAGMALTLNIKGADAAELFPLLGIALPPTPPYELSGKLHYDDGVWKFAPFQGRMGKSDIHGDLAWDTTRERPKLTAEFVSTQLRFEDLGTLIGAAPEPSQALSPKQRRKLAEERASPRIIPDVPLDISKLESMDAEVTFTGKRVLSPGLPLDDFYMKIALEDRLMRLTPVKFGTANGDITVDMTINARQTPVQNAAEFAFSRLSLARLMEGVGESIADIERAEGYIGGTMQLKGTGKSLHEMLSTADGKVGFGMEGGQISQLLIKLISLDVAKSLGFLLTGDKPVPIRCVVASFDVKEGVMHTRTFVVDTQDTKITGKGTVDLENEQLDLQLLPEPKEATALSLRSPINITGRLKKPDVDIEKGPLAARGGIATGLAALGPIAALLAFIEPGLGKDSNCAHLIHDLDRHMGKSEATDQLPKNE